MRLVVAGRLPLSLVPLAVLLLWFGVATLAGCGSTDTNPPAVGSWSSPVAISDLGNVADVWCPALAINGNGTGFVVWQQSDGVATSVWASRYNGSTWTVPALLEADSGTVGCPAVAVDGSGNGFAAWGQTDASGDYHVFANRYSVGTGWQGAVGLQTLLEPAGRPGVVADDFGNATAIWTQQSTPRRLWSARYTAGIGWGSAQVIDAGTDDVAAAAVASSSSGTVMALWTTNASPRHLWASRYAGGWSAPVEVDAVAGSGVGQFAVALDPAGNGVAVWTQQDPSDALLDHVWAGNYLVGSGWSAPTRIQRSTDTAATPSVAMSSTGGALALWSEDAPTTWPIIVSASYTPGGGWSAENAFAGIGVYPMVALDGQGNGHAAWMYGWTSGFVPHTPPFTIYANRYVWGSGWQLDLIIDTLSTDAWYPEIAADAVGHAFVAWVQNDASAARLWVAQYTPAQAW